MQKFILLVSVFVLSITQLHAAKNPLLGSWKVIKAKSAYVDATLSETECKQANGVIVTFLPDKIVVQKNNFFSGTDPNEKPHYRLKTVNALKYFHTKKLMKRFECSTSNVQID